jgi:hypothetical protein
VVGGRYNTSGVWEGVAGPKPSEWAWGGANISAGDTLVGDGSELNLWCVNAAVVGTSQVSRVRQMADANL